MHLTVPEPDITLYEDGFEKHDQLSRKADGEGLSELLTKIPDPLVVALNGPWGSGKSFFLKCWVGEHLKREGNSDLTLYFDAFANDYLDDPLTALISAIDARLDEGSAGKKFWEKAGAAAPVIGRGLVRGGAAFLTGGLFTDTDKLIDAFWKQEHERRAAMKTFRTALEELADETRLIIVIDELDRCRPDYALSLLEVIKHFFNVKNVHFVLGVNLDALQNTVRARYGSGIDAAQYLQKFIQLIMVLKSDSDLEEAARYFGICAGKMDIPTGLRTNLQELLELPAMARRFSLRDIERLLTRAALLPSDFENWVWPYQFTTFAALLLAVLEPDLYRAYRKRTASNQEVLDFFGVDLEDSALEGADYSLAASVHVFLTPKPRQEVLERVEGALSLVLPPRKAAPEAMADFMDTALDSFTLPASD